MLCTNLHTPMPSHKLTFVCGCFAAAAAINHPAGAHHLPSACTSQATMTTLLSAVTPTQTAGATQGAHLTGPTSRGSAAHRCRRQA